LNELADKTGGLFHRLDKDEHPEKVFDRILAELRNLYFVSYNNSGIPVDDKINVKIPGMKVRSLHVYRN